MLCQELILIFYNAIEPRKFWTGQYICARSLLVTVFVVKWSNMVQFVKATWGDFTYKGDAYVSW